MALNLVTDILGVVVFCDVRAIIGVDSMKCTGTIKDVHRLCAYLRAQGVKTGELVEISSCLKGMALNLVTDNVRVVVFGVDRAIIMGDSMKCVGAPVIIPRQSVYEPMTTVLKADTARASAVTCTALAPTSKVH